MNILVNLGFVIFLVYIGYTIFKEVAKDEELKSYKRKIYD